MARFFFDILNDEASLIDSEGQDLPNLRSARKEAQKLLPDIARLELKNDGDKRQFIVIVKDETARPLHTATLVYAGFHLAEDEDEGESI
jgi:hypothetical protein